VPALWRGHQVGQAGGIRPHRLLVPLVPTRKGARRGVSNRVGVRSPNLYAAVRRFCLGAFAQLHRESANDVPLSFSFEEHATPGDPSFYELRPLARTYVDARADRLFKLPDTAAAIEELEREPAARIFAQAHETGKRNEERALYRTILLPLLGTVADACGGFDWDDGVFNRVYEEIEHSLLGEQHEYGAAAPLVGLSAPVAVELGRDIVVRMSAVGELAAYWPEARGLLPSGFGDEPERMCILELSAVFPASQEEAPDAPAELADAVTALRLATAAPVAAGPILFERLDWRPYGIRPVLPIAATEPGGEPSRLDEFRGRLARDLLERLSACDVDPELGEAVDRWELSLFADEPFCSELLRESLAALLGGDDGLWAAAARAAVLVGERGQDRGELFASLRGLTGGGRAEVGVSDVVRRAVVEVLMHGDRAGLLSRLDESLLGLSPRPVSYFAVRAAV
jgi:hypothetical protein